MAKKVVLNNNCRARFFLGKLLNDEKDHHNRNKATKLVSSGNMKQERPGLAD